MASLRRAGLRVALVAGSLAAALLVVEVALRVAGDGQRGTVWTDLSRDAEGPSKRGHYTIEPDFGFRPVLGGPHYAAHGAQHNDYALAQAPGTERILFVGDSVTARGRIQRALERRASRPGREWWNGGVESYDLEQTLAYFERHLAALEPDRVVLTFHVNDFQATPVTFVDERGVRRSWSPLPPRAQLWPFGWRHAALWRAAIAPWAAELDARGRERGAFEALRALAAACRERGAALHVLVLPALQDPATWPYDLRRWHTLAIAYCRELDLPHTDLAVPLVTALVAGLDVQEEPDDWAHPSQALADVIADHLVATRLLGP